MMLRLAALLAAFMLIGGVLLGLGWPTRHIFLAATVPALIVTTSMAILGRVCHAQD